MKTSKGRLVFVGLLMLSLVACGGGGGGGGGSEGDEEERVDFGDVTVGLARENRMSIGTNGGSIRIDGLPVLPPPFSIKDDDCSFNFVTTSCSFTIRFAPISVGSFSHNFEVPSDAANKLTFFISGKGIASGAGAPPPVIPLIGSSTKGLTFDSQNHLYISTVSGKVAKFDGVNLSTFIPEGRGGMDFNQHIRFSQGNFYVQNVLNVGSPLDDIDEVLLFGGDGTFVRRLLDETTIGSFVFDDIAVNAQGQLYVAVAGDSKVVRIDANGQNLTDVVTSGKGGVFVPTSLAIDSKGNLYVGAPSVVSKFDADGVFLKKIVEEGVGTSDFEFATHLAVDQNDHLYIGNIKLGTNPIPSTWNVLRFDNNGVFQGEFVPAGAGGLSASPNDMGFDSQGFLYIADERVGGVIRFTPTGSFDRVVVKNFSTPPSSKPLEKSERQEEKENHYRELELKEKHLAEEFSQQIR